MRIDSISESALRTIWSEHEARSFLPSETAVGTSHLLHLEGMNYIKKSPAKKIRFVRFAGRSIPQISTTWVISKKGMRVLEAL